MGDKRIKQISVAALFTAMVVVMTSVIKIPTPATQGYLNFGDIMVLLTAILLGRKYGALAGGIGSALSDLLGGYASFAIFTLIIKGIEGYIAGLLVYGGGRKPSTLRMIIAAAAGGIWMVLGYFLAETLMMGAKAALGEVPANFVQAGAGIAASIPIARALLKTNMFKDF